MTQQEKVKAHFEIIRAVADVIQTLGSVPSGVLYARLMEHLDIDQYTAIVDILKQAKLVEEKSNVLSWIGPNT